MEIIIKSIQYTAVWWVIITMITSLINKYDYHKFDRFLCIKCISFWGTLILTQNVFIAAVASLLAYWIDKMDDKNINL
ncbi:MAG: Unknown protein [uncultured Sulfurovum sp.]|uniref:Uncharacterized protein n=1 Tax=uncultured Sulfurovum sp. TaxID=269237 RepID=A0A6S6ST19_9BACT|nr:MAG: Unknown protein [uncultured Sulfurovum sp.]